LFLEIKPTSMDEEFISAQIASDLFSIHADRMDAYKKMLHKTGGVELDMKAIIERILEESLKYKQQLEKKINPRTTIKGEIYKEWQTMTKPLAESDKKTILATLADDELIMMNTYSMALSLVNEADMIRLLESQQQELKKLHAHIRQYHDAQ
jgi:hypothetical protein